MDEIEAVQKQIVCDNCVHGTTDSGCIPSISEDYDDIYSFVTKNNLSERNGDSLLKLLKGLFRRHGYLFQLPKKYFNIKKLCKRKLDVLTVHKFKWKLNPDLFGENDEHGDRLKSVQTTHLDVKEQIGRTLMFSNPESFQFSPNEDTHPRRFEEVNSGDVFKFYHDIVMSRFGNDDMAVLSITTWDNIRRHDIKCFEVEINLSSFMLHSQSSKRRF